MGAIFPLTPERIALEIREQGIVLPNHFWLSYAFWREIRWCRWLKSKGKFSIRAADVLKQFSLKANDIEPALPLLGQNVEVHGDELQMLYPGPNGPPLTEAEIAAQKAVMRGRRFQFDLRFMLLLTLVVASASGWYAVNREHLRIRRQALAALEPFKPDIGFYMNLSDDDIHIDFSKCSKKFTDKDMVLLKPLSRIHHLNLNNSDITDKSLPDLEEFGWMWWLDLKGTKISPEGIERLRHNMPKTSISY